MGEEVLQEPASRLSDDHPLLPASRSRGQAPQPGDGPAGRSRQARQEQGLSRCQSQGLKTRCGEFSHWQREMFYSVWTAPRKARSVRRVCFLLGLGLEAVPLSADSVELLAI